MSLRRYRTLLIIADIISCGLSYFGSFTLRTFFKSSLFKTKLSLFSTAIWFKPNLLHLSIPLSQVIILYFLEAYDEDEPKDIYQQIKTIFIACLIQFLFLGGFCYLKQFSFPRSALFVYIIFNFIFLIFLRFIVSKFFHYKPSKVAIITDDVLCKDCFSLIEKLTSTPHKYELVGLIETKTENNRCTENPFKVIGNIEDLSNLIKKYKLERLFYIPHSERRSGLLKLFSLYNISKVSILPSLYDIVIGKPKISKIKDLPIIDINIQGISKNALIVKRALDILFSLIILVLTFPLMLIIGIILKIESSGSVLITQERIGKDGKVIKIHKLRTMYQENKPIKDNSKVTKIGKFLRSTHIDELPQFFDVLKGDLSIIGPRPLIKEEVEKYRMEVPEFDLRFKVKPGITGLAQIQPEAYHAPADIKLKYDLYYIYNYSFLLDLYILIQTIKAMLSLKGE